MVIRCLFPLKNTLGASDKPTLPKKSPVGWRGYKFAKANRGLPNQPKNNTEESGNDSCKKPIPRERGALWDDVLIA